MLNVINQDNIKTIDEVDFVIVIAKNIKHMNNSYNLYEIRKNNVPMYIITNGLNTENIVEAINITPHVSYINRDVSKIVEKILIIGKINEKKK